MKVCDEIMMRHFMLIFFFLLIGCTQFTMPNLPLGQVSEAFSEGDIPEAKLLDRNTYKITLAYSQDSAYPGWNLIAVPLGFTQEQLKVDVPYKIYRFTATGYMTDAPVMSGNAYWIKVDQPGNAIFSGTWTQPAGNMTQLLEEGWNQLGIPSEPIQIKRIRLQTNKREISLHERDSLISIVPVFYYWDAGKGAWSYINAEKPESNDKFLYPGAGYFVLAKKPATLVYEYPVPE